MFIVIMYMEKWHDLKNKETLQWNYRKTLN